MHLSGSTIICATLHFKKWTLLQGPDQLTHDTVIKPLFCVTDTDALLSCFLPNILCPRKKIKEEFGL